MKSINRSLITCVVLMFSLLFSARLFADETYAPPTYRGKVILVVDKTVAADPQVSSKIERLTQDLVGDGWRVLRHDVERGPDVPDNGSSADYTLWAQQNAPRVREVRALIKADYDAAPNEVKNVFLIGHIPVPYSGLNAGVDGMHYDGAEPADAFYGDMITPCAMLGWSDSGTAVASTGNPAGNGPMQSDNYPNDGKFDPTYMLSPMKFGVGRIDLSRMPAFGVNESTLISRYLDKDHDFRCGNFLVQRRAVFAELLSGYKTGANAIFGTDNVNDFIYLGTDIWFPNVSAVGQDYLLGYGGGWGGPEYAEGIGTTGNNGNPDNNFADHDSRVVFVNLYGSFFGNWEEFNDFLRAPLANPYDPANGRYGYGLDVIWASGGLDTGTLTQRALGATIGEAMFSGYTGCVNLNLMGDPTLRMHTIRPPTSLTISKTGNTVSLAWTASPDAPSGYNIYRAPTQKGPFVLVNTGGTVAGTSYQATSPSTGDPDNYYMIRSVKNETTSVGSYLNMSEGAIIRVSGAAVAYLNIQSGPVNQYLLANTGNSIPSSAVFTIDAIGCDIAGNEQISYRWYKDGVPLLVDDCHIKGANTGSLLIKGVQTSDAGSYSVVVSNSKGFVSSSSALLTMNPPLSTAVPDTFNVARNTPTDLNVFANDSAGVMGSPLNFVAQTSSADPNVVAFFNPFNPIFDGFKEYCPQAGTVSFNPDQQTIHFIPARTWLGQTKFTYVMTDGTSLSHATVTLNVVPASPNPPVISSIADQQLIERTTVDVPFTVTDDLTLPDNLKYAVTCSNPSLVVSISGTGTSRILDITGFMPVDSATVTLTFTDEDLNSSSRSFLVTVNANQNVPSFSAGTISGNTFSFNMAGPPGSGWSLYQSSDLKNWTKVGEIALSSISQTFADSGLNGVNCRFYKLSNGTDCSPPFGFYRVTATPGSTPAANQLDAPMNTLDGLFNLGQNHTMPDGTQLPAGTQIVKDGGVFYSWNGTSWLTAGGQPAGSVTLSPGEGAFIRDNSGSPFTVTFVGYVREGHLANMLPPGTTRLVSSMVPQAGGLITDLGYQPTSWDRFLIWNGISYRSIYWLNAADAMALEDDGTPYPAGFYGPDGTQFPEPTLNLGGIIGIQPAGSGESWTRDFDPCSGVIVPSLSNGQLSGGTFSFSISGPPNASWNVYSSTDLKSWTQLGTVPLNDSGAGSYNDNGAGSMGMRFYRLSDGTGCSRMIGFYQITAAPGSTIPSANQLDVALTDDPAQNTLVNVFAHISPSPGAGEISVIKPNQTYTWTGSDWLNSGSQTTTLNSGEGAFIRNNKSSGSFTVTYIGYVREGHLVNPLPVNTASLVSSMVPQAGGLITDLGYQPTSWDRFLIWNGISYRSIYWLNAADATALEDDGTPYPAGFYGPDGTQFPEPTLNLGGIIGIQPAGSGESWTRDFDPCSGVIVPGQYAGKALVNDSINDPAWHQGNNYYIFLDRAPVGWTCYLAGLGGTLGSASFLGMNWNPWAGASMIRAAADNGFDLVMDYGSGDEDPDAADYAEQHGCAVFCFHSAPNDHHYLDYRWPGSPIQGNGPTPTMIVSGGYSTSSGAVLAYGPQGEFIDAVWNGGLIGTTPQYDCAQSWAHSATAARYAKLKGLHPTWNVFDLRQALRQTCTFYAAGWRQDGGYGFPKVLNRVGDNFVDATINNKSLAEIDLTDLDVGPPIQPSAQISPDGTQITFRWYNFRQTGFASTVIKVNGTTIFDGDATTFTWPSTVSSVATAEFFTKLSDERTSRDTTLEPYERVQLECHLPVAVNDSFTVYRNTPIDLNVLDNDINFIGNNSALTLVSASLNFNAGTVTKNSDNRTIHFIPTRTWLGTVSCTYTVTDGIGKDQGTATLNIAPASANPPVISAIANQQFVERTTIDVPFTVADDLTSPNNLKCTIASSNPSLAVNITGTGTSRILHLTGFQPIDSATVTLTFTDEDLNSSSVSFQVTVNANQDIPSFSAGTISGNTFSFNMAGPSGSSWNLYQSSDLKNWTKVGEIALSSISQTFADSGLNGVNCRFYKLSNGTDCSPPFGFYRVTAVPGYTPIANQLDAPMNTLDGLFNLGPNHTMPDGTPLPVGTQITKSDATYTWNGTGWVNANNQLAGSTTLSPGEGAMIYNPSSASITVTFVGLVREGQLTIPLPPHNNFVSSMIPQAGTFSQLFSYSPSQSDGIRQFNGTTWVTTAMYYDADPEDPVTWLAGWYDVTGDHLVDPTINVGEAFLIIRNNTSSTKYATRDYSACGANNCTVPTLAQGQISSSETTFSFNINGVIGTYWGVYESSDLANWSLVGGVTLNATGAGSFADNNITGVAHRFYKLSNGECCSQAIGFERETAAPGGSVLANQLDAPMNTLDGLFNLGPNHTMPDGTSLPVGTQIIKSNATYTWNGTGWVNASGQPAGSTTLSAGEGAMVNIPNNSASITVTFVGLVREGQLTIPLLPYPGNNFVSSMIPQAGTFSQLFSYSPSENDRIRQLINTQNGPNWAITATYFDADPEDPVNWPAGWYDATGDHLVDPTIKVGEGFFIINSSSSTKSATRNFSPCSGQ